ncbi:putative 4-hydroxy-4-methyl-2-oxoglutarate aldolase [Shewanella eurypsychrophilus]|uniref:4-hydroxy-4-methyl-2-oxoglutarate aldolase n=1 Tax=Shewanella eurypsychrophilus TaxID=2593656 RepID=A0ABX6V5R1_9GAMM|nr:MULTISPECIES: putative 4-hydroxy-4-methyl-2-oxoglutarate aldolase [Shewanella]QFU22604.1 putative 4-hydroxy-4-methyl-2-oxoglutarate aldolase [Shewanella sp. YLB-09]QPG57893.1 putative 4-hydroxy-4-methyl-2-oxoglutarate aldolase [Shewanella eurypsychrophilus]
MIDLLPDLFDDYSDELSLFETQYYQYGGKRIFWGEINTVKCFEDNSKVRDILGTDGKGKVLVVDGGGSMNRALLGDLIAMNAVENGWEGIVIYGCVRDAGVLETMNIGVKALGANPIKTKKKGVGEVNSILSLDNIIIEPGMMLYSDRNGIAIAKTKLNLPSLL